MIILDTNLPPNLALWITAKFQIESYSTDYLKLSDAEDKEIFLFAREKNAIVITKDDDFVSLLMRYGSPPKIIWLTCGNTSKPRLQEILTSHLVQALDALQQTDLVEITGR